MKINQFCLNIIEEVSMSKPLNKPLNNVTDATVFS